MLEPAPLVVAGGQVVAELVQVGQEDLGGLGLVGLKVILETFGVLQYKTQDDFVFKGMGFVVTYVSELLAFGILGEFLIVDEFLDHITHCVAFTLEHIVHCHVLAFVLGSNGISVDQGRGFTTLVNEDFTGLGN